MQRASFACLVLTALVGCSADQQRPAPATGGDNSRNALDWPGAYVGTLPCADCEGIRMRIELRGDGTFSRSLVYLGRDVSSIEETGRFEWDAAGSRVTLRPAGRDAQQYQVGENVLFHLDRDGQRVAGDLAAAYRLAKIVADARLENRRWRLVELNGRPVTTHAGREGPYLELDPVEGRVAGNASCNRFFGTYELTAGNRLRFGANMGATMMACPDLEQEREFLDALARVDNYTLAEGTLSLNRARMAPLARFRLASE